MNIEESKRERSGIKSAGFGSAMWSAEGLEVSNSLLRRVFHQDKPPADPSTDIPEATTGNQKRSNRPVSGSVQLPMVAPKGLGHVAASLLAEPIERTGLHHVEGPQLYSPYDVAAAFAHALNKQVKVVTTPRAEVAEYLQRLGVLGGRRRIIHA